MVRSYVGLGSNLDAPAAQIRRALVALHGLPATRLVAASSLYRSPPMGPPDQPDYVNAVAGLDTGLEPESLLGRLLDIEAAQGRIRQQRWGARTLDLDLLLYGQQRIAIPGVLTVPHPGIAGRPFVLVPLAELAPDLTVPGVGEVSRLLADCDASDVVRCD